MTAMAWHNNKRKGAAGRQGRAGQGRAGQGRAGQVKSTGLRK